MWISIWISYEHTIWPWCSKYGNVASRHNFHITRYSDSSKLVQAYVCVANKWWMSGWWPWINFWFCIWWWVDLLKNRETRFSASALSETLYSFVGGQGEDFHWGSSYRPANAMSLTLRKVSEIFCHSNIWPTKYENCCLTEVANATLMQWCRYNFSPGGILQLSWNRTFHYQMTENDLSRNHCGTFLFKLLSSEKLAICPGKRFWKCYSRSRYLW